MYVCVCHAVTDSQIRSQVQDQQVSSLRELAARTRVATSCGRCAQCARELIVRCGREGGANPSAGA